MEQQEKAKTGGKQRRSTVGDRLVGSGNIGNKNQQTSQQNKQQTQSEQQQDIPQLGQVTQQLKDVNLNQQQTAEGELGPDDGGNAGRNRAKQFEDKEIRFDPPWDQKLGQMQQVVRNLQRHTTTYLDNRGSIIIRCYPYKSATYMHLVYQMIYEMLSLNQQMGHAYAPTEIRPILLHYDDNGLPNPEQQPPAPYSSMPQINQQPDWTDIVLVRVRFDQQSPSIAFLQNFNRNVCRAFDRRQVRCPFAHPDLTQPERILRHRLQQICMEKNGGFNRRRRNRFTNYGYNNNNANEPRFFHNGLQIYKEYPNGCIEPVPFENYTEVQCLHVVVASLRKYATLYREKETSVIMQNIDLEELEEADFERITELVYLVVNSDEYRQRCQAIQERIKSRQDGQMTTNNVGGGNQRDPHEFLPVKIERLPRRKRGGAPPAQIGTTNEGNTTTIEKESAKKTNGSGGGDGGGEEGKGNDQQKEEAKTEGAKKMAERPPLVRIQFRNKESVAAFCQLFKTCQEQQKKAEMEKNAAEGERGHSTADSYSDLSDLEEVFSSSGEENNGEGGTKDAEKKEKKKQKRHRRQPKMCLYFPNAFVHRDLTPPELALGYALRQFCREKNAEIQANDPTSSNMAGGSGANNVGGQQRRFYTRLGRIYERREIGMDENVAAPAKEG